MEKIFLFLFIQSCVSFDLPRNSCKPDLSIDKDHYNVSDVYHVGDALPTDAHYDEHGNLFYVESGRNLQGFYFDIKVIEVNSTSPRKISGMLIGIYILI